MLKSTSYEIATYAARLYKKLSKYDQLDGEVDFPNWWQSKLILAKDYVSKAYHYLDSEEKQPIIDKLALEHTLNEAKYNTVEKVLKKLGRRPSEQELASFITKNYYDVTGVKRGDDDPSRNEKIADLISFYNFDPADFEIAWHYAQNESVNEASGEFVVYVEKDNGRKKLLHTKKSQRAANMFMSKNVDKILNTSGIRSIGSMSKDEWEKKEAQFAENIKKTGMKTVTKKEWDRTHKDYKGMIKGKPYIMWFDKKTQSTVYGPVNIKESVNESTPDQVIKDLDKAKNDLLKKVNALIAKKKKLYSDVDIEAPMSADEKKLDKDIADLFSQINKLVLQKRSVKKESVNEGPDKIQQFDDVHIKSKNLTGTVYSIKGNDVVVNTLKKGLVKAKMDDLTKLFTDGVNEAYDKRVYDSFTKYLQKNAAPANLELFDPIPVGGSIFNKEYEKADNVLSFDWNIIDGKYTGSVKQKIDNFFKKAAAKFNMKPIHIQVGSVEFAPASDKIDEARSIGVVQREWGKTVDKMKSIVADWKGAEGSKKDDLTKKLKDLTKKKKELEQELNDAVMSKGIDQSLSAVDEAIN